MTSVEIFEGPHSCVETVSFLLCRFSLNQLWTSDNISCTSLTLDSILFVRELRVISFS